MTHTYEIVDQNILLYEARLKHIDEVYQQALQLNANHPDVNIETQLAPIKAKRESLANFINSVKTDAFEKKITGAVQEQHSLLWQEIMMELEILLKPFESILPVVQTSSKND